jgi:hypothetical protein
MTQVIEKNKNPKLIYCSHMGVSYYKCENCCQCYYEEYVGDVDVEDYAVITLCQGCRDENMVGRPSEFVDIDEFEFVATQGDNIQDFKSFYGLQSFILGEPDDGIESHTDWHFGIKGRELSYATSNEEAQKAMTAFEDECRWEVWEKLYKNEENSIFTPKREWLESELKSVSGQLENLQNKKRRLEEILAPQ